jgi:phosphatidylglycerophosphate synthase
LVNQQNTELKFNLNIPHVFTAVRVLLAIVIIVLLALGTETQILISGVMLIFAATTDFFDGFLARKLGQTSLFGSLFDVVADELLFIPCLILAVIDGRFAGTAGLFPWTPYLYAIPALAGGTTVLIGVGTYLWKRRSRPLVFPTPPMAAKINYWFWLFPLILALLGIGPALLLAVFMYLAVISTIIAVYTYLKKGAYVFTG